MMRSSTRFLTICALALILIGTWIAAPAAHAAGASPSPLVVIAIDVTNRWGPCIETFDINISSARESITRVPCPAGTITAPAVVTRARALAIHEPYVALPDQQSGRGVQILSQSLAAIQPEINDLLEARAHAWLRSSESSSIHPLTACGQSSSATEYWSPDYGDDYVSWETYYKSSDCSSVALDQAAMEVDDGNQGNWYWMRDQYAASTWYLNPMIYLAPGTYTRCTCASKTPGYYYENWINDLDYYSVHDDLGPIN